INIAMAVRSSSLLASIRGNCERAGDIDRNRHRLTRVVLERNVLDETRDIQDNVAKINIRLADAEVLPTILWHFLTVQPHSTNYTK
ncbi:MAG: hypothetical protein WB817_11055, partial [Terriglobales bacterium]